MTSVSPARWTITTLTFLLVLLVSSALDLSLVSGVCIFFVLGRSRSLPFFIAATFVFILHLVFDAYDITTRFISDLAVDAYLLFISGVILYFRWRRDERKSILKHLQLSGGDYASKQSGIALSGGILVFLLLSPMTGGYAASIIAYGVYSYLTRRFNGKVAVVFALFFLVIAAVFLLLKQPRIAELIGNYVYFFLAVGTIQEIVNLIRSKKPVGSTIAKKPLPSLSIRLPSFHVTGTHRLIIIGGASSFLSFMFIAWVLPRIPAMVSPTPLPILSPTPPPDLTPVFTPSPALVATAAAEISTVQILVQNGTDISGLAASTAAKLRDAGFTRIEIGNAEGEYDKWEIALKDKNDDLRRFIQQALDLTELSSSEATVPAAFDILVIAGRKK